MNDSPASLSARGLRVTSRMAGRTRVLVDGVDLEVAPGEAVAIVGESGSGKSITARALAGVLPAGVEASGSIRIGDEEFAAASERRWRDADRRPTTARGESSP